MSFVTLAGWICATAAATAGTMLGQAEYMVQAWGTQQGLPQDAVRAIAQTSDGYLWVGTFGGLARFDGRRFEVFSVGNTAELPDNLINALFCDREGRLWIGHDSGHITVMEGHSFRRVALPPDWQRIPIRGFGENTGGEIWVLNAAWRLGVINSAKLLQTVAQPDVSDSGLHFDSSAADGLLRVITMHGRCYVARTNGLLADPDAPARPSDGRRVIRSASGGYWAVHETRLCRWLDGKVVETIGPVDWGESIFAITCEWNGMVAAGTFNRGLELASRDGTHRRIDTACDLPSNWIAVLFVDREGVMWVGTGDAGLAAIWSKRVRIVKPPGEAARKHIQSVSAQAGDVVWVATEGAGLFRFSKEGWSQAPEIPGQHLKVYASVWIADDGRLWATTPNDIFCLEGQTWHRGATAGRASSSRGAVLLMSAGAIWVTGTQELLELTGENFSQLKRIPVGGGICCLAEDGAGGVWFGGYGTGLGHWRRNESQVLHAKDGLPSENLLSLYRTQDGTLWIGTDGNGLVRMKEDRFAVIAKRHGLPSDTICQITPDEEGRLWMGTYSGICAASIQDLNGCASGDIERLRCLVLDTADGMETLECSGGTQPSVCRTADGRLWFATRRGVAVVSPSSIVINTNRPFVWIEHIQTDAGPVTPGETAEPVSLPPGQRRLQISFNAPCLRAAHRVRFRHRLDPIDPAWIDSDGSREVTYARVPPGEYQFRVIACNEDGVWNESGAKVAIRVPPFLWERAWFAPLCWTAGLGTVGALVLIFIRQRLNRRVELLEHQRAVERERSRIAKDLHDDLGGSLTEINMLASGIDIPASPDRGESEAVAQIGQKSARLVSALDEIVWAVNPKHDSVASLADYLSGAAREFLGAAGIRVRLDMQRTLPPVALSPELRHELYLAAKEALSNVIHHSRATEACLRMKAESDRLSIVIEDNGCGFDTAAPAGGGDGMGNMRERLAALGGTWRISSRPGSGTSVHLEVPLK